MPEFNDEGRVAKIWVEFIGGDEAAESTEGPRKADAFRGVTFDLALETYGDDDAASRCIDLLTDARHWCDLNGQKFADLDRQADLHYLAETNPHEGSQS